MQISSFTMLRAARAASLLIGFVVFSGAACDRQGVERIELDAERPVDRIQSGIYRAADPAAAEVTLENLHRSERFWPHQIQLVEDWKPPGWKGDFGWGVGVVIRVDESSRLRVDFSRFGKHWIPAHVTDVVARANAIRMGEDAKFAPNLVLALKNRLLDPSGRTLAEIAEDPLAMRAFVLVFVDPRADDFPLVARSLTALGDVPDVLTVLLAQGGHADSHVYKASYDAGWPGAFLLDRFSPAYTEGFLDAGDTPPFVQVATPEGRLLWEGPWDPDVGDRLQSRLGGG